MIGTQITRRCGTNRLSRQIRTWFTRVAAFFFLAATAMAHAGAPATRHVAVDLSTPKNAVRTMFAAEEMADGSALRDSFFAATQAERDLVTAYAELIVAARHLRDAARDKFAPDNGAAPNPAVIRDGSLPGGPGPEDEQQLANAQVQVDGDSATVRLPDSPAPIKLKRSDNQWRIDLADYAAIQPSELSEQTEVNHGLAAAMDEAAEEIIAGKYASAQEAESAIQQKIHAVIAPQLKKLAATAPTTRESE
jgi:hypothetical protein